MPSGNDKRFQKFKGHKRRRHGNVKNPLSTPATPPNPNAPTACRWAAQGFYGIIALTFPYRRSHIHFLRFAVNRPHTLPAASYQTHNQNILPFQTTPCGIPHPVRTERYRHESIRLTRAWQRNRFRADRTRLRKPDAHPSHRHSQSTRRPRLARRRPNRHRQNRRLYAA